MVIESYETQLERVQATIKKIEDSAQSYSISDSAVVYARLDTLYEREETLRTKVSKSSRGSIKIQYVMPER